MRSTGKSCRYDKLESPTPKSSMAMDTPDARRSRSSAAAARLSQPVSTSSHRQAHRHARALLAHVQPLGLFVAVELALLEEQLRAWAHVMAHVGTQAGGPAFPHERPEAGQSRPSPVGIQQSGKATFAGEAESQSIMAHAAGVLERADAGGHSDSGRTAAWPCAPKATIACGVLSSTWLRPEDGRRSLAAFTPSQCLSRSPAARPSSFAPPGPASFPPVRSRGPATPGLR
jgi:hypothetical protein